MKILLAILLLSLFARNTSKTVCKGEKKARIADNTSSYLAEIRFTPTDVTNRRFSVVGQFKWIAP
jgi:hypothetical protein